MAAPSGRRIEAQRGQVREPRPPRGIDRKRRPTIGNLAGPARAEQNRSAPVAHPRASRPGRPSLANPFCADRRSASKPARRYWGTGLCGTGIQTRGATDEAIASTAPLKRGQLLIFFARRRQKGEESPISALSLKTHTFSFRKPIINALVEFNPIVMNKRSACLALLALVCCANGEKDRRGRYGGDVKARRGAP